MDVGDEKEEAKVSPWLLIMIFWIYDVETGQNVVKKEKNPQVLVVGNNEYNFACVEFEVPIGHQGEDTLLSAVWRSKDSIWFRNTDFDIFIS